MFWNQYIYRLRVSVRTWDTLFWTWVFPLLLATLFFFAFSRLDSADAFAPIPAAVVADEAYQADPAFSGTLDAVSAEGEGRLLLLTRAASVQEADALLDKGAVTGYFRLDAQGVPCLIVKEDGLNQTILKSFLDEYRQTAASLSRVARENPDALPAAIAAISRGADYTQEFSLSAARPSATVNYYYALLAMVCLYGSFTGMDIITYLQANLSPLGARRSLAPVKKMKMVLADLLSGFTIHSACLLTTLAYIALVLRVDFGPHFGLVLLTCLAGSLVGVSLGALLSAATRLSPITKTGLLVSLSMVCCFLAGLMREGISYQVAQNAPAVAWLNPAARIADAFYCLYYFDTYHRFFLDIGVLLAMAAALFGGAVLFLRRRKYESI